MPKAPAQIVEDFRGRGRQPGHRRAFEGDFEHDVEQDLANGCQPRPRLLRRVFCGDWAPQTLEFGRSTS